MGEIQRVQPPIAKTTISKALSGAPSTSLERTQTLQSFPTCWKELAVETFTPTPRALEVKNVLVTDTLLGTVPGAQVAAFGRNNHVGILCSSFSSQFVQIESVLNSTSVILKECGLGFLGFWVCYIFSRILVRYIHSIRFPGFWYVTYSLGFGMFHTFQHFIHFS